MPEFMRVEWRRPLECTLIFLHLMVLPQNPSQCTSYLDSWTWKTRNKKASDRYGYITRTTIPTAHCAILGRKLPRRQHFQWTRCRTNKNNHPLHTPCTSPYTNERQHTGWTATSPPPTYRGRRRRRQPTLIRRPHFQRVQFFRNRVQPVPCNP